MAADQWVITRAVKPHCHLVFTLTEEVGSGARAVIGSDVSEVIGVDIGPVATGQGARELGVTIPLMDSAGPHDYHLTRRLLRLCEDHDVRTALLCFGADASHGYERTHLSGLINLAELLVLYIQSGPTIAGDREPWLDSVEGFLHQLDADQLTRVDTPLPDPNELLRPGDGAANENDAAGSTPDDAPR